MNEFNAGIEKAKKLIVQEQFDKAGNILRKILRNDSNNKETHFELGKIYYIQKKYNRSIEELRKAIQKSGRNYFAYIILGKNYRMLKNYKDAINILKKAERMGCDNIELKQELELVMGESKTAKLQKHISLGEKYEKKREYDLAIEELKRAAKLAGNDWSIYFSLARAYRRQGRFKQAIKVLKGVIKWHQDSELYLELGCIYKKMGEYDIAEEELKKAKKLFSDSSEIYFELGRLYREKGQNEPAIKELKAGLRYSNNREIRAELEDLYKDKRENRAEKELGQKKIISYNREKHFERGRLYIEEGKEKLAIEEFEEGLKYGDDGEICFELGLLYKNMGEYNKAEKELKKAKKLSPDSEKIYFELGKLYSEKGKKISAIREFKEGLKYRKDGRIRLELGRLYKNKGEYNKAEKEFKCSKKLSPEIKDAYFELGRLYSEKRKIKLAIHELEAGLRYGDDGEIRLELGYLYKSLGWYDKAKGELGKAKKLIPKNKKVYFESGRLHRIEGRRKSAIRELEKGLRYGEDGGIRLELGSLYRSAGEYDKAKRELRRAKKLIPETKEVYFELGGLYKQRGQNELAIKELEEGLRYGEDEGIRLELGSLYKEKMEAYFESGRLHRIEGRRKSAIRELEKGLRYGEDGGIRLELGSLYRSAGEYDKAKRELRRAKKLIPETKEVYFELGRLYKEKGQKELAIKELEEGLKYGEDGGIRLELGSLYRGAGKYDKAKRELRRAKKLIPETKEVYFELGRLYKKEGKKELAIQELEEGLKYNDKWEIRLDLGLLYKNIGAYDKAEEELKKTKSLSSDSGLTYLELGRLYKDEGKKELAIRELEEGLKYKDYKWKIRLELGRLYKDNGEYDKAEKELEHARDLSPGNKQIHFELGKLYGKQNNMELAAAEIRKVIKDEDEEVDHLELGRIYWEIGDINSAIKQFENSLNKGSESYEIHRDLGLLYEKAQNKSAAIREFKICLKLLPRQEVHMRNRVLNKIEMLEGKEILNSKPRGCIVQIATECNLRCRLCPVKYMNWEIPKRTVREIIQYFPYLQIIQWFGGEVFLWRFFKELSEKAAQYPHLQQVITTNGLLIDEKWAEFLVRNKISVGISVDGVTKKVYEDLRTGGSFETLIKKIKVLNRVRTKFPENEHSAVKFDLRMQVLVTESNYRQLREFVEFGKRFNFNRIILLPLRGRKSFLKFDNPIRKYIYQAIPELIDKCREYKIKFHINLPLESGKDNIKANMNEDMTDKTTNFQSKFNSNKQKGKEDIDYGNIPHESDILENSPEIQKGAGNFCAIPWQWFQIEAYGQIRPYSYCLGEVGSIESSSIKQIWNGPLMQKYRRKILEGNYYDLCDDPCKFNVNIREEFRIKL